MHLTSWQWSETVLYNIEYIQYYNMYRVVAYYLAHPDYKLHCSSLRSLDVPT